MLIVLVLGTGRHSKGRLKKYLIGVLLDESLMFILKLQFIPMPKYVVKLTMRYSNSIKLH